MAPITVESMLETIEQLRKAFPDLDTCRHPELVTSRYLPVHSQGTRYVCTRCSKILIVPDHLIVTREAKVGRVGLFQPI